MEKITGLIAQGEGYNYLELSRMLGLPNNILHNTLMAIENRGTLLYEDDNGGLFIYERLEK